MLPCSLPLKCENIMAEDIRENAMTVSSSVDYVRGLKGKDSVLIRPDDLPHPNTGSGIVIGDMDNGKWYRIAIGGIGSAPSSAIINVANYYSNTAPGSKLLYVSADGYSNLQSVVLLSEGGKKNISKARILYNKNTTSRVMLDVYVYSAANNEYYIAYSNNINFTFQTPEEVSETIPDNYLVKEFSL